MDDYGIASVGDTDRPRQAITNLAEARRGGMDITSTLMDFTELYTIQNAQLLKFEFQNVTLSRQMWKMIILKPEARSS